MIDVLVTGRSLPALQAALDFAEVGLTVAVATGAPAHLTAERDPDGVIADFLGRIAEPIDARSHAQDETLLPQLTQPHPPMLRSPMGEWLPQPSPSVLGVSAVPLSAAAMALTGGGSAFRAYLDRVKPLLTVGKTKEFGRLVRNRMGKGVLNRVVEPQVFERYGVRADQVEAAVAAPGLNEAMSRSGALTSGVLAYSERNVERETRVQPAGGYVELETALLRRLSFYGVELLDAQVVGVEESFENWVVSLSDETRLEARAVVADQGRTPFPSPRNDDLVDELLPGMVRVHACADAHRPTWLEPGHSAVAEQNHWGVRVEPSGSEQVRVHLLSAALPATESVSGGSVPSEGSGSFAGAGVREMAERLGDDPALLRDVCTSLGLEVPDESSWAVEVVSAPYVSLEVRDAAQLGIEHLARARDTLLPVGRALHGDDLGAALAWSHRGSVALRRRLLGLGPEDDSGRS